MSAVSSCLLAATGIYCLVQVKDNDTIYAPISYVALSANAFIGALNSLGKGGKLGSFYHYTTAAQNLLMLPGLIATLSDKYGYQEEISYAVMGIPVLSFGLYVMGDGGLRASCEKAVALIGSGGLGYLCVKHENYPGLLACVSFVCMVFFLKDVNVLKFPPEDLANVAMAGVALFGLKALSD